MILDDSESENIDPVLQKKQSKKKATDFSLSLRAHLKGCLVSQL